MGLDLTGFGDAFNLAQGILNRLWPNKNDPGYIDAQTRLITAQQAGQLQEVQQNFQLAIEQIKTNAIEAASPHLFVAGARPFIMWVCGVGLAVDAVVGPLLTWLCALAHRPDIVFPHLNSPLLQYTMGGLLGIGQALRTAEKFAGVVGMH